MRLQTAYAIYSQGQLIFDAAAQPPADGTEVVITYVVENSSRTMNDYRAALRAFRGRAKGEQLTQKLLASRQQDRDNERR